MDPEIWEIRIHFDGLDNLERSIGRDDVTFMNIVAMIETQGYGIRDSIFCRTESKMELVDSNAKIYELLEQFQSTQCLNLIVKSGRAAVAAVVAEQVPEAEISVGSVIKFAEPVVYDLSPPPVYVIDEQGSVLPTQPFNPYVCTQESINVDKGKSIDLEEEEEEDFTADFDMGEPDYAALEEKRTEEEIEIAEMIEERRKVREDPLLHCEGDTDVEDLFVTEEEPAPKPEKKKKLAVIRGPTTRCHSSVVEDDVDDYKPSSDEDMCAGFLEESDDDGFEPLSMVPPKGGKSRSKKRPERKWYDDRRLLAHEQLCLKMCFRNVQQFRDALINLHIAQSRNFSYHRNSNVRIIVQCKKKNCPFFMVASEIKGEKTFCIRKMRLRHTCGTTNETTRVSARWLANNYEGMFRSDPNTGIQSLIDLARQQHGVEVPRMMAYRAKNLAVQAVLGDHRQQYFRLRDFAQTVVDTNPGSRVIVTTVTPAPTAENPNPGPHFHGLFFCLNAPREGFLKGCRPFIGEFFAMGNSVYVINLPFIFD